MAELTPNITTEITAPLNFPVEEIERKHGVDVFKYRDGRRQSHRWGTTKLRAWRLSWVMTDVEWDEFVAFYDARTASENPFYWDNIQTGELDIPVAFRDDQLPSSFPNQNMRTVSTIVEEIVE